MPPDPNLSSIVNGGTPPAGTTDTSTAPVEGGFLSVAEAVAEQLRDLNSEAPPTPAPVTEDPGPPSVPDPQQPAPDPFGEPSSGLSPEQLAPPPFTDPGQETVPEVFAEPEPVTPEVLFEHEGTPVTLEEARRGFLREADYSRKTMELADQRRSLDGERQGLQNERQLYVTALETLKTSVAQNLQHGSPSQQEMDRLRDEDRDAWLHQREVQREHTEKIQQIEAEQHRVYTEQQAAQQQQFQSYVQDQQTRLAALLPDWNDEKVGGQRKLEVREYLKGKGFSDEEMGGIYDHRLITVLLDAVRGRAVTDPAALAAKKVVTPPAPALRASARRQARPQSDVRIRQAETRLDQSGSLEDAVALQLARQEQRTT